MKSYSTVVSGREMSKFIKIPDEFLEAELKVVVVACQKKEGSLCRTIHKSSPRNEYPFLPNMKSMNDNRRLY
jgi:hypothetical protein